MKPHPQSQVPDIARLPLGPKPGWNGKSTRRYVVTVTTENFVEVNARDADHAREQIERRLLNDFGGPTRMPRIAEVEEVEG